MSEPLITPHPEHTGIIYLNTFQYKGKVFKFKKVFDASVRIPGDKSGFTHKVIYALPYKSLVENCISGL
jgi:hypothetical protein